MGKKNKDIGKLFRELSIGTYITEEPKKKEDKERKPSNNGGSNKVTEERTLNRNCSYMIPLSEVMFKIRKENGEDSSKPFKFSSDVIRIKSNGDYEVNYIKDMKAKYIACVINNNLEFSKLEKRRFPSISIEEKKIIFIPLYFIRSLLPEDFSRSDGIESELADISIFKYTGDIEILDNCSIFSLAKMIYLARKPDYDNHNIRIII